MPNTTSSPVRCDLNALTADERAAQLNALKLLLPAFTARQELKDGFRLSGPAIPIATLTEWIDRERRCCPFLRFQLDFAPEQGPLSITIRGPKGTREILRAGFAKKD